MEENKPVLDMDIIYDGTNVKAFMSNVFSYMTLALVVSGIFAYWFGTTDLINYLRDPLGGPTILGWVVMFAPIGFVLLMSFAWQKFSPMALLGLFGVFAVIMGISFSYIFIVYDIGSIYKVFGITALTFGVMALLGYTTNTDLTKFGSILKMALIGIIIAMIVNFFMRSDAMSYVISVLGVLIFTGLTAYDTQKLKRIGMGVEYGTENASKLAIMGALSLYLDFVNLFLFLLRLLGNRD